MRVRETIISFDWLLTGAALLLAALGLTMLFSSASDQAIFAPRFTRQLLSLGLAVAAYAAISLLPYHTIKRHAPFIYAFGLVTLVIVSQIGRVIRGTTSRFELIGAQIQPSEFMKIALVIALAWLYAKWENRPQFKIIASAIVAGLAVALVVIEPDVGTAALMAGLWAGFILYLGVPWRTIALIGLLALVALAGAWYFTFADYQKNRILTFINPSSDPLGAGYNVVQSKVALGSGGWFGRGLGHGPQSQLKFLPEQHTDFIFASIGEELGFVGVILVFILYVIILYRILQISQNTEDTFGRYLAIGVFFLLLLSLFISAGMNMGLLPVTGIPLPLVSYGGSNLLSTLILLALVQSVHIYNTWVRRPPGELTHF